MSAVHVLRVQRSDTDDYILIRVANTASSAFDLRLVATDGNNPYVAQLRHGAINQLRAPTYHAPTEEWQTLLSSFFLGKRPVSAVLEGLEVTAALVDYDLMLSIRKNIGGITQRLGTIPLVLDEDESIELFDWAGVAASSALDMQAELDRVQTSMTKQQDRIAQLTAQLDDFIKAKKAHEDELLAKFAALLNSKKLKIRDQQRLLAQANLDPEHLTHVEPSHAPSGRNAGASRAGKRKADRPVSITYDSDDLMDADAIDSGDEIRDGLADPLTPEKSDLDDTEDGDSDADDFAPAPVQSQASRKSTADKGKAIEPVKVQEPPAQDKRVEELPPRRELPFGKSLSHPTVIPHQTQNEANESEDETDDDEL